MTAKRLMLLSLIVSVVGVALLILNRGNEQQSQSVQKSEPVVEAVTVLVADQSIVPGEVYSPTMFRWQSVERPELDKYIDYITRESIGPNQLKAGIAHVAIKKGQVLSMADITRPEGSFSLATKVRQGFRAISVPVDQVTANSGFILPGDKVDILLLGSKISELKKYNNLVEGLYVSTIATQVRVLAFNQLDNTEDFQDQRRSLNTKVPENSSVSLEVTPEQATQIVLANQLGKLTLSLRSVTESGDAQTPEQAYTVTSKLVNPDSKLIAPDVGLVQLRANSASKK